jgi:hypothetical protein
MRLLGHPSTAALVAQRPPSAPRCPPMRAQPPRGGDNRLGHDVAGVQTSASRRSGLERSRGRRPNASQNLRSAEATRASAMDRSPPPYAGTTSAWRRQTCLTRPCRRTSLKPASIDTQDGEVLARVGPDFQAHRLNRRDAGLESVEHRRSTSPSFRRGSPSHGSSRLRFAPRRSPIGPDSICTKSMPRAFRAAASTSRPHWRSPAAAPSEERQRPAQVPQAAASPSCRAPPRRASPTAPRDSRTSTC